MPTKNTKIEETTVAASAETVVSEEGPNEEVSLLDKIEEKKEEAKAVDDASQALAKENNLPSDDDENVVSKGERILSAIGYLSFLCILPLVLKPKSEFCQMHGKQGLILIVLWVVFTPIRFIGDMIFNSTAITGLFGFCYLLLICYGIYTVVSGKKEIPILSKVAKKLTW